MSTFEMHINGFGGCRNFPQGTIGDMEEDVSQGISFVCNNIADYGGDPNRFDIVPLIRI